MKRNITELPKMNTFAKKVGATNVKAYHAYIYDSTFLHESLFFDQTLTNKILSESMELAKKLDINIFIPKLFSNTGKKELNRPNISDTKYSKPPCLFLWKEAFLEPNGDISSCFFPFRLKIGSIKQSTFKEIWNNELYQSMRSLVSKPRPGNICESCELRNTYVEGDEGPGIEIEQFELPKNHLLDYYRPDKELS